MTAELDAVLGKVRASFLAKAGPRARELRGLVDAGDCEGAKTLAHRLHGMAGTFGFEEVGLQAGILEAASGRGRDWTDAAERLVSLLETLAAKEADK